MTARQICETDKSVKYLRQRAYAPTVGWYAQNIRPLHLLSSVCVPFLEPWLKFSQSCWHQLSLSCLLPEMMGVCLWNFLLINILSSRLNCMLVHSLKFQNLSPIESCQQFHSKTSSVQTRQLLTIKVFKTSSKRALMFTLTIDGRWVTVEWKETQTLHLEAQTPQLQWNI